jgi:hypothetical protein
MIKGRGARASFMAHPLYILVHYITEYVCFLLSRPLSEKFYNQNHGHELRRIMVLNS